MTLLEGSANLRGRVAYVPQQAWMQNASLRDNVLFGRKHKKDLYQRVRDERKVAAVLMVFQDCLRFSIHSDLSIG